MIRRIPSIRALQCFEQTARTGSVSRAAESLFLTQSAVSRQLRTLEAFLGRDLFERERQRLVLTPEGETYLDEVRAGLDRLETATLRLMSAVAGTGVLNVAAPPTFGSRVLIPCLASFNQRHPDIVVNFISRIGGPDFAREDIDAAILYGSGEWPDLEARPVSGERLVALCRSDLLAGMSDPPVPADLGAYTLLHTATRPGDWPVWLATMGAGGVDGARGPKFEHFTMAVQAAAAGLGVALVPTFIARDEIAAGRLVDPFRTEVESPTTYYVASPKSRAHKPEVRAFIDWIDAIKTQMPFWVEPKPRHPD